MQNNAIRQTLLVQGAVLLMSLTGVFQKLAGRHPLLSLPFILLFGVSVLILGVYAILWQIILKRMPLSVAYSNRAISTIWTVLWGVLLFHEGLTWNKALGAVIICAGVYLVNSAGEAPAAKGGGGA